MSLKFLFVLSKAEPACLPAVKQALTGTQDYEVSDAANFAEAQMVLDDGWSGLVFACVTSKDELTKIFGFLQTKKVQIFEKKSIRVLTFNTISNVKVISTLTKLGVAEVLDFSVTGKAMMHKIQRHIKLVKSSTASAASKDRTIKSRNTLDDDDDDEDQEPRNQTKLVEPLTHARDFWLLRPTPDAKRVMARWMIEMIGPGPSIAQWEQTKLPESIEIKPARGENAYAWKPRDPQNKFATPDGQWIFTGRSVEFDWRVNRWRFIGDRAALFFVEQEKIVARRFFAESAEVLLLARNSRTADALLPEIESTYAAEIQIKAGKEKKEKDSDEVFLDDEDDPQSSGRRDGKELGPDDEDAVFEKENSAGKDLFGEFEREAEGKELGGKFKKDKEGGELNGEFEADEAGGTELSGKFKKEKRKEGKDGVFEKDAEEGTELDGTFAAEKKKDKGAKDKGFKDESRSGEINDKTGEDEEHPDYNDNGARRQNIFNSGRGLTQGHKSDKVTYGVEDFSTGTDAFKPISVKISVDAQTAEILDQTLTTIRFLLPSSAKSKIAEGAVVAVSIHTENMDPDTNLDARCKVLKLEAPEGAEGTAVEVELGQESQESWKEIQEAVERRQMIILEFLKMARGY